MPKNKPAPLHKVKPIRFLLVIIIALISTISTCVLLTSIQGLIPTSLIEKNMNESHAFISNNLGSYPNIYKEYQGSTAATIDNYTNYIMVEEADNSKDLDISWSEKAIPGDRIDAPYKNIFQKIFYMGNYDRYWHGYLVYLKPLLMFFDYKIILVILTLAFVSLSIWSFYNLKRLVSLPIAITFLAAILLITPEVVATSPQQFSMFGLTLVATNIMLLLLHKKRLPMKYLPIFFLIIGGFTSYFDFLTTPLLTIGIPLIVSILYALKIDERIKNLTLWKNTILSATFWGIGYACIWFSKWAITSLILGEDRITTSIHQTLFRMNGCTNTCYGKIGTVFQNLHMAPASMWIGIIAAICLIYAIYTMHKNKRYDKQWVGRMLLISLIGLSPFVWFVFISNHSSIHYWFTFRILAITIFAELILIYHSTIFISNAKKLKPRKHNLAHGSDSIR